MIARTECDFQGRLWEIRLALLSLPPPHAARNLKGMADGQVAMLEHKVTLKDVLHCGTAGTSVPVLDRLAYFYYLFI